MTVHARISKEWRRRMTLMALMINGSAIWFCYDGFIAWPAEEQRHQKLVTLAEGNLPEGTKLTADDPAVTRLWTQYAKANDFSVKVPKHRSPGDLAGQRITGCVMLVFGLLFIAWMALQHRKSVRADGDIITGADGEQVHLDSIVEMDRRKWNSKGIAYAIYEKDGKRRRLCLDDHKFLGCEEIILEAERRIAARAAAASSASPDAQV